MQNGAKGVHQALVAPPAVGCIRRLPMQVSALSMQPYIQHAVHEGPLRDAAFGHPDDMRTRTKYVDTRMRDLGTYTHTRVK